MEGFITNQHLLEFTQQYLCLTRPPYHISITHDKAFMSSNHVLTGMIKNSKREGKDVTTHKKPVAEGDIEKLYSSGFFNTDV